VKRSLPGLGVGMVRAPAGRSEAVRRRGRPKGSGKPWSVGQRWTDFQSARIWALFRWIIEAERLTVRDTSKRLAGRGYVQGVSGKPAILERDERGRLRIVKPGGPGKIWGAAEDSPKWRRISSRSDDPSADAEQLRKAYRDADKRRRRDPDFRERCDWWLRVEREIARGGDPLKAFMEATRPPD